jgi:transposase InsO family protein
MGLQGVIRGKPVKTTISDKAAPCPLDHVNRQFRAPRPNVLWLSDFTYVATWSGFVYVAFVIDAYARRIVGWRASRTAHAGFVLDALEQALHDRRPIHRGGLVHHSERGSQYVSIKYTERLAEAGVEPSVGSVGDSSLQGRGDPSARAMAKLRGRRVRDPGMGGLVQQPTAPRAHRQHPACRSRATLLRNAGTTRHGGIT